MSLPNLLVHATNVTGLGASQVVSSILEGLQNQLDETPIEAYLPAIGPMAGLEPVRSAVRFHRFRRRLPNSISRLLESLFSPAYFPRSTHGLTLGDIPIQTIDHQVVLVHQSHLVAPRINVHSKRDLNMRIMRRIFRRNLRFVHHVVVQSDVMKDELGATYPEIVDRMVVVPQPPPPWFQAPATHLPRENLQGLRLFYPAAGYPHKNHRLLVEMDQRQPQKLPLQEMRLTLEPEELHREFASRPSWIQNLGRLSPQGCRLAYEEVDALFFPSVAESYGLPLVEAMVLGLPVVCSDLPFAQWMCGDQALYFDPNDADSAWHAIQELEQRWSRAWRPDWSRALAKLPTDWTAVAGAFVDLLRTPRPVSSG